MKNGSTTRGLDKSNTELVEERAQRTERVKSLANGKLISAVQLPLWDDFLRAIPNEIARCPLFNCRNRRTKRQYLEDVELFVMGDAQVNYRGLELRQDDEVIWLQVMHMVRMQPLGEWVEFVPSKFMEALGWRSKGKKNYDRLKEILSRLSATSLTITSRRMESGVNVSLVRRFEWRGRKLWRVWVEPEMKALFPENYYSRVLWQQRLELPSGIASKLHSYFASHKDPLPIRVSNVQALCDSGASPEEFRKSLVDALEHLRSVVFLERFWIDSNDVLRVVRARAAR